MMISRAENKKLDTSVPIQGARKIEYSQPRVNVGLISCTTYGPLSMPGFTPEQRQQ